MLGVSKHTLFAESWLIWSRLRAVRTAKLARVVGYLIVILFAGCAVLLRKLDGPAANLEGYVVMSARWSAWACGGLVALAAASQRSLEDRREGIEVLASLHGVGGRALLLSRVLATSVEIARVILVTPLVVGIVTTALSPNGTVAGQRAIVLIAVLLFALMAGVVLGILACVADAIRPRGGRGILLAVIFLPWVIADLAGKPGLSIPGLLGAFFKLSLDVVGVGRLA